MSKRRALFHPNERTVQVSGGIWHSRGLTVEEGQRQVLETEECAGLRLSQGTKVRT